DWSYHTPSGYLINGTTIEGSKAYEHINGTEGNLNDEGGRFPDTEDLNQNGSLDLRNDYFEYSFSLDKTSPDTAFISGGKGLDPESDYGWRLYRIPLAQPDTVVGNPQWTNIEYVRIWVDEAPRDTIIMSIAEIKLVGSEWKERGLAYSDLDTVQYDAANDTTVRVTVVNTYDNPDYDPPPGVAGEIDPITKVQQKEQSLVLKVKELPPGANGIVQKAFFQPQSYINYKKMKMYVYGKDPYGLHIGQDTTSIVLFFRFGANEHNYYEFREKVYPGWDKRNEMLIDFEELTGLKNTGTPDEYGRITKVTKDGDTLRVVGKPSLTNMRQLTVGVINYNPDLPFTGEIWLDELRLSDVKKDRGKAMRARMDLRLADIATINAEMNRVDDDFRTVNERFGKGNNQLRGSLNASIKLDKFLPQTFGLSIPLSFQYQRSEASPKYFPGSDIIVSRKTATDSLLETIKTINNRKAMSISFRKSSRSHSPLLKYTIDAVSMNYAYSESFQSNSILKEGRSFRYNGTLNYSLAFNSTFHVKPFSWLGNGPIIKSLSQMGFYPVPKRVNYKLSFNRAKDTQINRNGLVTPRYTFVINQNFSTSLQPLRSLSLDYTRSHVNDLREILDPKVVFQGEMGPLTSMRQSIRVQFNPNFSNWLRLSSSMSTNFSYNNNIQQKTLGKSASNNITYNLTMNFNPQALAQKFARRRPSARSRARRRSARRPPPVRKENAKEPSKKEKKKQEKPKRKLPNLNPLRLFLFLGNQLQPISVRYSQKISSNNYGLVGMPPLAFQIGRTFNPGPIIQQNVGSNRGSFNRGYNIDAQSGLQISRQLRLTLKYAYNNSYNRTTTTTGSISDTKWRMGNTELPIPDWKLRWSGLEKLPFLSKYAQSISLDHSRNGRLVLKWQDSRENTVSRSLTLNYRPFIGLNVRLKNGINATLQYNLARSEALNLRGGVGGTRKRTSDINASITYAKRGGLSLGLPFLGKKVIKNSVDFSMNFVMSSDVSEQKSGQTGKYVEWTRNEKWSIMPRMTYSFSSTVRGGIRFEFGRTKNKLYGETRILELGINVNIQISGS
ncbi:MAG TPA: cell surface protein SprA, partial [Bacteroidetes bacterium]|nr:cell surface protein SprA [Bacteroidota bacterium]